MTRIKPYLVRRDKCPECEKKFLHTTGCDIKDRKIEKVRNNAERTYTGPK